MSRKRSQREGSSCIQVVFICSLPFASILLVRYLYPHPWPVFRSPSPVLGATFPPSFPDAYLEFSVSPSADVPFAMHLDRD